jgi:hypothetical protein
MFYATTTIGGMEKKITLEDIVILVNGRFDTLNTKIDSLTGRVDGLDGTVNVLDKKFKRNAKERGGYPRRDARHP